MRTPQLVSLNDVHFPKEDPQMREEIIKIILQYLRDEGYPLAMRTLADEHHLKEQQGLNSKRHMAQMRHALLNGEWSMVDKLLSKPVFKDQPEFQYAAFKQRYMELLEGGEHQLAYEFLHQRLKPLGGLSFASEAELKDLCFGLISRPEVVLRDWDRVRERGRLVESFQHLLLAEEKLRLNEGHSAGAQLENRRLLTLLHQAAAYQVSLQGTPSSQRTLVSTLLADYEQEVTPTTERLTLRGPAQNVKCVQFVGPELDHVAFGSSDTVVRVCHLRAPDEPLELRGHTARVWHVAAGSGTQLASAAGDGTVRLWDYAQPLAPLLATYGPHDGDVYCVGFHSTYTKLVSAGYDACARLWDVESGEQLGVFCCHSAPITSVLFNKYGNVVVTGSKDGAVKFIDCCHGVETMALALPNHAEVASIALDHTGLTLLVSYRDSCNRLWDLRTQRCLPQRLKGHRSNSKHYVRSCFGPRGNVVCGASEDGYIYLWNKTGELLRKLKGHVGPVYDVQWCSKDQLLASCGEDRTVRIWSADTVD
eukprot:EG_transcript_9240